MTFLKFALAVGAVFLAMDLLCEFLERHQHYRRIRKWPEHGHTDHFFTDLRRGYFPEDLN